MPSLLPLVTVLTLVGAATCEQLLASHFSGQVYTLNLTSAGSKYNLSVSSVITACGGLPSWLTYDAVGKAVYCSDETMSGTGSISSFSAGTNDVLTVIGKANAPIGGVANTLFGGSNGRGYVAIAHYQASKVSTFKLPITSSSVPQQVFTFTMNGHGPNYARQDAPHPHHVVLGPNGSFIYSPDLGADQIRVWSINHTTGNLTSCPSYMVPGGTGPRHATFVVVQNGARIVMYVANELANTISVTALKFPSNGACPTFQPLETLSPFPNNATAPIATWTIDQTSGMLDFVDLHDSWGTYPRTFSINKAGTLLAVGDQTTANVAVLAINTTTGEVGATPVANLRLGTAGHPENEDGLSSVVWAE
ncbi:hypothetical protein LTR62_003836 [Meristemomyces frigidus]|uniref:6-phosphogluconolactonase n=1 Tax=Meristemomyces frigidus TaxID=1508187 RepID=A0AAN7YKA5_9PEZI|nr:hypothetical protein LTR62_003836 [Meristemomyces frigidus]